MSIFESLVNFILIISGFSGLTYYLAKEVKKRYGKLS